MPRTTSDTPPPPRIGDALAFAAEVHASDLRKGTTVPYLAHLLGVCALVLVDGGDEDEAIAALLHDSIEDHADVVTRELLEARYGARVAQLVQDCTDTPADYAGGKKPPWRQRKEAYITHVRETPPERLRVSVADKVDNLRAILANHRVLGAALWTRFNAGQADQQWYYSALTEAYRAAGVRSVLLTEFERLVGELGELAES